jgi:trimeric autotransporter adhesin
MKHRDRKRNRNRRALLRCEPLEGRVVLANGLLPASLLGSLANAGVVIAPIFNPNAANDVSEALLPLYPGAAVPAAPQLPTGLSPQIDADQQALQTELQTLSAKSAATIQDLQNLTADSQSIAQTGFTFNGNTLNPVISELATAVAGGASTSQAQADFSALFSGSSVSQTSIDSAFADLVKAIQDSGVTTTDLATVASDEAAIIVDISNLSTPPLVPITTSSTAGVPPPNPFFAPGTSPTGATVHTIVPFNGATLINGLAAIGVVTTPVVTGQETTPPTGSPLAGQYAQLQTDAQTLSTELDGMAAKSGLTVGDLQNLANDAQQTGPTFALIDAGGLRSVLTELATAISTGASTAQAQTDFISLFGTASVVSTATLDAAFKDLAKAIQDSNINSSDLAAVAGDQAAIESDEVNLGFVPGITSIQLVPWTVAFGTATSISGTGAAETAIPTITGPSIPVTNTTSPTTEVTEPAVSSGGAKLSAVTTASRSHSKKAKAEHKLKAAAHAVAKNVKVVNDKETDRVKRR